MADPRDVVIIDGVRTPFAKSGTKFKDIHAAELGRVALKELMVRTNVETELVDDVIVGNTGSPSDAVNIARVVALNAGFPKKVSAATVHRNCASAMESIANAFDKIKAGVADIVAAGGTESMSNMPLLFSREFTDVFGKVVGAKSVSGKLSALSQLRLPHLKPRISLVEGLTDPFVGLNMGQTGELLAKEFGITRQQQDEFALASHQKAVAATKNGTFAHEITPVFIPPHYEEVVNQDIGPRDNQTMESLAKLKPFFDRKYGTVTVGNACPVTDGAAMVLVMSRAKAKELGLKPAAKIVSYAFAGLEPERMGLGPVYATPIALKRAGLKLSDMGLIELNEAFAAQVLACNKAFASPQFAKDKLGLGSAIGEVDPQKLNVNGGAIALGHPVGTTGTRLVVTLMKEMARRNVQFGLATLCIGGGQGGAMILEREA
ncbi:MAG TPA: thiolase family protein [Bdellovibrionales bacterium]|nr:thiolase family protein [Bdellovibrionales bacterium]